LNDPSTWEKRRLKGKLAVQKMVVNLMELYLQRMRLKRPPYPKPAGKDEFAAEFPYVPTPDQCQVLNQLSSFIFFEPQLPSSDVINVCFREIYKKNSFWYSVTDIDD
jgi:hypothetical protein